MKKIILIVLATSALAGCWTADRESTGIQRCSPNDGFENAFPSFEYDAKNPETKFVIDLVLGPQEVTFRDRISGNLMTVGKELDKYYTCVKVG